MHSIIKHTIISLLLSCSSLTAATPIASESVENSSLPENVSDAVGSLDKPMYSPFIERYVLDELKQIRIDQANQRNELMQQILDREHKSVDRAVAYSTDTITYFFYLIAGATSLLVIVGWNSIRDIKDKVHSLANEQISKLVNEYELRLQNMENQIKQKTKHIEENKEEIELTQEIQSLWLRAGQDNSPSNKIAIYDKILKLKNDDCEALTYKADAVLELNEPQWASNLCHQALEIDPENSHAFYQLACAYAAMEQKDEAVGFLVEAIKRRESYREEIETDPAFHSLINFSPFTELLNTKT